MERQVISVLAIVPGKDDLARLEALLRSVPYWEVAFTGTSDLAQGRGYLQRRTGDVVVTAAGWPGVELLEWVAEVRQRRPRRPVVVLVDGATIQERRMLLEAGATEFLMSSTLTADALRVAIESGVRRYTLDADKALLQAELRESQKMEAVGTLAAGIAHDFNNLLTSIKGYLQIVQQRVTEPALQKYLGNMETSCDSMADLIRRLMAFAHREETRNTRVNVRDVLKTTAIFLSHALPKNIALQIHMADQPLYVYATVSNLQQMLLNLCVNAAEAMGENGTLTLSTRYLLMSDALRERYPTLTGPEYVEIVVADTGPGIAPQHINHIFEPFFTTKSLGPQKGTGLGLALVWQIVRETGGHIQVETEVGVGTRFQVVRPYSADPPQARESGRREALPEGHEQVLIVDDEPKILDVCASLLTSLGYTVRCASSGEEAIRIAEEVGESLHCVVMDLSMPQMDGFAAYERLHAVAPGASVIFASGHDVETRVRAWDDSRTYPSLQKPFGLKELAVRLREVLDTRNSPADAPPGD
ncbi:MAG: response regulator [Candidatus Hydrogenedentes bacterium]|nr:response regulator [Candidatus Hydrogenedentota bacterium]